LRDGTTLLSDATINKGGFMTTTTIPTIRDLITYVYENPGCGILMVSAQFQMDSTDAEELLCSLDEEDGTLYHDGEGSYQVEDQDSSLEDVIQQHYMGGGQSLDGNLPVKGAKPKTSKSQKAQKGGKVTATATKTKPKAKPKAKKTKAKAKPKAKTTVESTDTTEEDKPAKPAKAKKGKTQKKATRKSDVTPEVTEGEDKPKERKTRVVKPRASRIVEDDTEAQKLGVDVGTEVKTCVDCKVTYPKFGGEFRPRWKDADAKNAKDPDVKASPKHVQPRCIGCDKLRSKRKSRFTGLQRAVAVEDIGDPAAIVTHPDRKKGGVPDGKFSVALIDDTGSGFTPILRGVLVSLAEGLIKLRWASGDSPEILGATKTAIKAVKAPKVVAPEPKKPKAKAKPKKKEEKGKVKTLRVMKGGKAKAETPKPKAKAKPKAKTPKAKPAKKTAAKAKTKAEDGPW
jgi:hypothetical protein